jgi:ABC-2 type transport system permease protein
VNLLRTELSRFFARRFLHVTAIFIVLVSGAVLAVVAGNSTPVGPEEYAAAQEAAQSDYEVNKAYLQQEYQDCVDDVTSPVPSGQYGDGGLEVCAGILEKGRGITPNDPEVYLPAQFRLADELDDWTYLAAAMLCVFGFAIGASFVGAEWTSGGMTNLVLWVPRRIALLATKLGAALLSIGALSVVFLGLWVGSLAWIAQARGNVDGATPGFWQSELLLCVRVLVLVLAATTIGFALASLGRHTAAALGISIGYALIAEIGTMLVFGVLNGAFPERFRLSTYIVAWLTKRLELYEYHVCLGAGTDCGSRFYVVDLAGSAAVLGALVVLLAGGALLVFRRRDIA